MRASRTQNQLLISFDVSILGARISVYIQLAHGSVIASSFPIFATFVNGEQTGKSADACTLYVRAYEYCLPLGSIVFRANIECHRMPSAPIIFVRMAEPFAEVINSVAKGKTGAESV